MELFFRIFGIVMFVLILFGVFDVIRGAIKRRHAKMDGAAKPSGAEFPTEKSQLDGTSQRRLGSRRISPLAIIIGVLIIAAIAITSTLIGFLSKDDSHKAIGLINKADPFLTRSQEKWNVLSSDLNSLFANIKEMKSAAQYETEAGKLYAEVKDVESDLNTAQGYLGNVSTLKGVKPYKDFVEALTEFIKGILQEATQIREYLNYVGTQVKRAETGQPVDSTDVHGGVWSAFVQKMQQLDKDANAFREQALQMYDSLNMHK